MQQGFDFRSYFSLLRRVAACDGTYCGKEKGVLMAIARNMQVDSDPEVMAIIDSETLPVPSDEASVTFPESVKRAAIRDGLLIVVADGSYSETEEALMRSLCAQLKLPAEFLDTAHDWVQRYCEIVEQGQELFS